MQPLLTARRMAALAQSPEEQELAKQAVRIADHVVDLAVAESIRRITEEPPAPTPEIRELASAKQKAQAELDAARKRVEALTAKVATAQGEEQDRLEDLQSLARAQQELAQDELDEAAERLARAGGDPQARIQRLRDAYEAAQKEAQPPASEAAAGPAAGNPTAGSLVARLRSWGAQREKRDKLEAARGEALERAQGISARIERVTRRLQETQAAVETARKRSGRGGARAGLRGREEGIDPRRPPERRPGSQAPDVAGQAARGSAGAGRDVRRLGGAGRGPRSRGPAPGAALHPVAALRGRGGAGVGAAHRARLPRPGRGEGPGRNAAHAGPARHPGGVPGRRALPRVRHPGASHHHPRPGRRRA